MNSVSAQPPTDSWVRRRACLRARIGGLDSPDVTVRRLAQIELSDSLAADFTLGAPSVRSSVVTLPTGLALDAPGAHSALRAVRYHPGGPGPWPTAVFLHGGGFMLGSAWEEVNHRLISRRCQATGVQFLSLNYPLAPEHPFPAAIEAVAAVTEFLYTHPQRFDVDRDRIALSGFGSGGTIAAAATLMLRDRGLEVPSLLVLEVPGLDLAADNDSSLEIPDDLDVDQMVEGRDAYIPRSHTRSAYASPASAPDLSTLPATVLFTAEHDVLRPSSERFAQRAVAAGSPVRVELGLGHTRDSPAWTARSDDAVDWQRRVAEAFTRWG